MKIIKKRDMVSLILHIAVLLMTVLACLMRFGGVRFFSENVAPPGWSALRYFTTESNVLIGLIAIPCIVVDSLRLAGKIKERPFWIEVAEFVGASCLALTMITVLFILGPGVAIVDQTIHSFFNLYFNHNLFFHLLTPIAAIFAFLLNASGRLNYRFIIVSVVPALMYEVFYSIVAFSHMDASGKVAYEFDWYGFMRGGVVSGVFSIIGMAGLATLLSFLLLFFYKRTTVSQHNEKR